MALFWWGKSRHAARDRASLSLTQARLARGEVLLGDLHKLKTSVAEARYENDFNNAKAAFLRREFEIVAALLQEMRETYAVSQMRMLHKDPKAEELTKQEAGILADKQAAIRDTLDRFDEIVKALHLTAAKESKRQFAPRKRDREPTGGELPEGFAQKFDAAEDTASRTEVIQRYFCAVSVNTTGDVKPATLYAHRKEQALTVLITADRFPTASVIPINNVLTGKRLKPLSIQDFLALGKNQELVQLQPRQRKGASEKETPAAANGESAVRFASLDLVAFNQLVLSSEQSGLISSIPISNARDQFFRQEKYQHAYGSIERAYQEFVTKASQRTAKLRQDEQDYKRGRLKMSPKKWQAKQRQDAAQTQKIERARKHFKLVLDGLRLLNLRQQQGKGE